MSSSLPGRVPPGRQFAPHFGPTSEEDPTSYELSEGPPKPARPQLFVCNPDPSPAGDYDDARARSTSGLTTSPNDADFTDKISGQYDRRLTSFSVSDGGAPGNPSDSNEGGTGCLVDNTPWWQNQAPPDPPKPWYKRSIASVWKKDDTLPSHLQPWWRRNKWIVALLLFLGTLMLIIGILWATGTLTGANLSVEPPPSHTTRPNLANNPQGELRRVRRRERRLSIQHDIPQPFFLRPPLPNIHPPSRVHGKPPTPPPSPQPPNPPKQPANPHPRAKPPR